MELDPRPYLDRATRERFTVEEARRLEVPFEARSPYSQVEADYYLGNLDPKPYLYMGENGYVRYAEDGEDRVFKPLPGFSQDRKDYA